MEMMTARFSRTGGDFRCGLEAFRNGNAASESAFLSNEFQHVFQACRAHSGRDALRDSSVRKVIPHPIFVASPSMKERRNRFLLDFHRTNFSMFPLVPAVRDSRLGHVGSGIGNAQVLSRPPDAIARVMAAARAPKKRLPSAPSSEPRHTTLMASDIRSVVDLNIMRFKRFVRFYAVFRAAPYDADGVRHQEDRRFEHHALQAFHAIRRRLPSRAIRR